jgi:hypothetical protein
MMGRIVLDLDPYLLRLPTFRVLLVALGAGVASGVLGWRYLSGRAREAWDCALAQPLLTGPGVYRAASRGLRLSRMPLAVPALGFTSSALHVGHAIGVLVAFAGVALQRNGLLAAAALALTGLGVLMSRGARALVTRHSADADVRRRVEICAVLFFLVHAALVIGLVALERGLFNGCFLDVYLPGIKGFPGEWRTMSLGELRGGGWFFPSVGGVNCFAWIALGLGLLVYASGAVVEAALVLWVARRHALTLESTAEGPGGRVPSPVGRTLLFRRLARAW